ncbi:MAG: universal stress protein [Deltaproteobacteria bacterium]|nr:universal stress protein [Deltaproteobacteria bacterium]
MQAIRHVLIPTDFSETAEAAIDVAIGFAAKFDASMTLLHVYTLPMVAYGDITVFPVVDLETAARSAIDGVLARVRARYPKTEAVVRQGPPAETIVEVARERGCDLIVIGTHGRRGMSHLFLGSVAERVVRSSHVPVLTVRAR